MTLAYYFLTLDYCNTQNGPPTKQMYLDLIKLQFDRFALAYTNPVEFATEVHPIECFEYKHKSKKHPEWLHYHCIVQTYLYIKFKEAQVKNWSIKYIKINSLPEMARVAGYIQKDKIDKIYINKYTCY